MVPIRYHYQSESDFDFLTIYHHNQQLADTMTPTTINIIPIPDEHPFEVTTSDSGLFGVCLDLCCESAPIITKTKPTSVPTIAPTKDETLSVGVIPD